jgi:hypothetical protein
MEVLHQRPKSLALTVIFLVLVNAVPVEEEVSIRSFGVGLVALAAFAAAGFLLRRRRPALRAAGAGFKHRDVASLYVAGL